MSQVKRYELIQVGMSQVGSTSQYVWVNTSQLYKKGEQWDNGTLVPKIQVRWNGSPVIVG